MGSDSKHLIQNNLGLQWAFCSGCGEGLDGFWVHGRGELWLWVRGTHHHQVGRLQTGEDVLPPSETSHLWQVHPLALLHADPIDSLQTGIIKLGEISQLTNVDGVFPQTKSHVMTASDCYF